MTKRPNRRAISVTLLALLLVLLPLASTVGGNSAAVWTYGMLAKDQQTQDAASLSLGGLGIAALGSALCGVQLGVMMGAAL